MTETTTPTLWTEFNDRTGCLKPALATLRPPTVAEELRQAAAALEATARTLRAIADEAP